MSTEKPRRLGRGLEALLSARTAGSDTSPPAAAARVSAFRQVSVALIRANSLQPRKEFALADLEELEASIRANGLLQPITVRAMEQGFELIAGERRFRAVQRLGWLEVPAIVKEFGEISDKDLLTLALVENLQRTDLNPIEEADGFQILITRFSLTQQQVADVVGKDRSTVANTLRLLALPVAVRRMVREGSLTIGHARALLALGDDHRMNELANATIADGLSVRAVEQRVREAGTHRSAARGAGTRGEAARPPEVARIEEELRRYLQTDIKVRLASKEKGELRIAFYSADDLERLLHLLLGATRESR